MSATRLHKLTAVTFAVLYGVVGVTGEGLHYLLTDPALLWSGSQSAESVVYYHTHGPDYHGHFHRHTHDGHHRHVAHDDDGGRPTDEIAITDERLSHEPHACPALVLVSTLKLAHGGCCLAEIILDSFVSATFHSSALRACEVARSFYPRGPPGHSCA
jgi:hypothetical protein